MAALTAKDPNLGFNEPPRPTSTISLHSTSSSAQIGSETSTLNYDQESWDLFRPRVESLCQMLLSTLESTRTSWKAKLVARIRDNRFLHRLITSKQALAIERLRGGDFNRIIGIALPTKEGYEPCRLILRVPRWGKGQIERIAATSAYISRNSSIPIAAIVAKDGGRDNPLNSPYIFQKRLPGSDLEALWGDLSHNQRCTVAREVGFVVHSLLALESPVTGHLDFVPAETFMGNFTTVIPFALTNTEGDLYEESEDIVPRKLSRENETAFQFLQSRISRWRTVDLERNGGEVNHFIDLWDSLSTLLDQMNALNLIPTELHCLSHSDLYPRNIMAQTGPDNSIRITGILDWDDAIIAPKVMCCEPPAWLWGFDRDDLSRSNWLGWPFELPGAGDVPLTMEQQELKQIFEEHAGAGYQRYAYDAPSRSLRCLFRIALFGLTSSELSEAAERLIKDWGSLQQSSKGIEKGRMLP